MLRMGSLMAAAAAAQATDLNPNEAGVPVFHYMEDGYNCTRIPTIVLATGGQAAAPPVLLAFAEGRKWVGDGCIPWRHGAPVAPRSKPGKGDDQPYTDIVMKRSTDGGKSFSAHSVVIATGGWCPTAVMDANHKRIVVQYSLFSDDSDWQITSDTLGLTWSRPLNLNRLLPAGRGNMVGGVGHALQLSLSHPKFPGRLLWIGHRWSPAGNYTGPPDPFEYAWWSDDGRHTPPPLQPPFAVRRDHQHSCPPCRWDDLRLREVDRCEIERGDARRGAG